MAVVALVFTLVFIATAEKEKVVVEPVMVNFTCSFNGVVKLQSDILQCNNGFDIYCKDGKIVCMKEITRFEVVNEKYCFLVC